MNEKLFLTQFNQMETTEKQALIGVLTALRQEEKYWTEQENRQGTLFRRLGMLGGLALVVLLI